MPDFLETLHEFIEAINAYKEALKDQNACASAWESGDPCAMAENDPSDLYIKEMHTDNCWSAVVVVARNLSPQVTEFLMPMTGTRSELLYPFHSAVEDYNEAKADEECCEAMGIDHADVTARVARAKQDIVDALQDIAEVMI